MAEAIVDLLVTPEVTMSSGVELRRHSTGKASACGNNEEKAVPHYLRASTGSCHDVCKYGTKQASKAKDRSSIPKRAERKHLHQGSEGNISGIIISVAKPRASTDFAKRRATVDSKPTNYVSGIKRTQSADSELLSSYALDTNEPELPQKSSSSQRKIGIEVQICRNKTSLVKVNPSLLMKCPNPKTRRQESSSTLKVETSSKSTSKKEETPLKSTCERAKTCSESASKKTVTSSKLYSLKVKETEFSEKHVISFNPNSGTMRTNVSVNSSEDFGGRRRGEIKVEKREASHKIASPLRAPLSSSKPSVKGIASTNGSKHKSLKIVSLPKSQSKPKKDEPKEQNDGVEEKTLYVIKTENGQDIESSISHSLSPHKFTSSSISQSLSQEDEEESGYTTSEFEEDYSSENYESDCLENENKTLEAEKNGKRQKDGIVCFEDDECQMLKLKIIRRKLAETEKTCSPRRLKFRRGKVWWSNGDETGQEKVFLRHHEDVKGMKDGQVLFNNMIEETANKLVETKKSKVKALVGAFETVIFLQEQNPSAKNIVT